MAKVYWLTEVEWMRIEPLMPRGRRGARRVDDRWIIGGIVHSPSAPFLAPSKLK